MAILATFQHDTSTNTFHIIERKADGPQQDPIRMEERDASGGLVKDWGTHAWAKGAAKFAASRGFGREVCTNCDQWRHNGECTNECTKRGFAVAR